MVHRGLKLRKGKEKSSFKGSSGKSAKGWIGVFRAIPEWVYIAFVALIVGIEGTILVFAINSPNKNLPVTQIVNDRNSTCSYAYDGRTKGPSWVLQVITPGEAREIISDVKFYEDTSIPPSMRSQLSDFQNSGFDIAHLVNVSEEGVFSTEFPISTASPQLPQFNRVYWAKIDSYIRELVKKLGVMRILVITGPLYLPHKESNGKWYVKYQVIGENQVAVPTHFFKAIFYPTENFSRTGSPVGSEIYVIPNQDLSESVPLDSFRTSIENFQKISGVILPEDIKSYIIQFTPQPKI